MLSLLYTKSEKFQKVFHDNFETKKRNLFILVQDDSDAVSIRVYKGISWKQGTGTRESCYIFGFVLRLFCYNKTRK